MGDKTRVNRAARRRRRAAGGGREDGVVKEGLGGPSGQGLGVDMRSGAETEE